MKTLLLMLLAAVPAGAAEIVVMDEAPLLQMMAARDKACAPVAIGGRNFLATFNFDEDWESWFTLKPAGGGLGAGAWKESGLAQGAVYRHDGLEINIKENGDVITLETAAGDKAELSSAGLFDRLYNDSRQFTFGGAVTYAVFRNIAPLSEDEGTVTLRRSPEGQYFYSVTRDAQISAEPRWLLAVNGVLYGIRAPGASLQFVSKEIEGYKPFLQQERAR